MEDKDVRPNHFARLLVLRWLFERFSHKGPSRFAGYFALKNVIDAHSVFGFEPSAVSREVEYLVKANCIVTEDFRIEGISEATLLRLAPAGFVHLEILSSVNYLAAVAEDTWFDSEDAARRIADRIKNPKTHYTREVVIENARDLLKFLEDDRARRIKALSVLVEGQELEILTDLKMAVNAITEFEHSDGSPIWNSVVERYPRGSKAVGTIVNVIERHGVFVEIEPGITGLIWPSKLPESFWMLDEFSLNERVEVEINNVNASKHRIEMSYLGPYRPSNVDDRDQLTLKMPMFSQTTG